MKHGKKAKSIVKYGLEKSRLYFMFFSILRNEGEPILTHPHFYIITCQVSGLLRFKRRVYTSREIYNMLGLCRILNHQNTRHLFRGRLRRPKRND